LTVHFRLGKTQPFQFQNRKDINTCLKTHITKQPNIMIMPLRPIGQPLSTTEREIMRLARSTRQRLTSTPRKLTKLRKLPTRNRRSRNRSYDRLSQFA